MFWTRQVEEDVDLQYVNPGASTAGDQGAILPD